MFIDLSDTDLVGQSTPDPLRYAFVNKKSAHAGGMAKPLAKDSVQTRLTDALSTSAKQHSVRCLYVHIPFCRVRCTYCNFFQYASSKALMEEYFQALLEEIKWKSAFAWSQSEPFQAVYIGGGTPTDLTAKQLQTLASTLKASFPLTNDCEITLEGRVNRFDKEKFESALEGGINRFSFGVQSFNTQVRRAAKRLDDKDYVLDRIQDMASYNAAPIVIDLLYGLPHQTLEIWQQDLNDYIDSNAHGVDLYQLIHMGGLPMTRLIEQGKLPEAPDTATKASMFEMGVEFMAKHHQKRLSVNHWASSNRERSMYNSLAKTTAEVLPLGAGAGGNFAGYQMMHVRDLDQYTAAIAKQEFPTAMVFSSPKNKALNAEIKAAFDAGYLSKRRLDNVNGTPIFERLQPLFEAWQTNGLITWDEDSILLTLAGQFWAVTLAQNLIKLIESQHPNAKAA